MILYPRSLHNFTYTLLTYSMGQSEAALA